VAEGERFANNRTYLEMKAELASKREGSFAVIALGKLQGYAPTLEGAYGLVRARAPRAKHAIIKKIGEKLEAEAVWELGLTERQVGRPVQHVGTVSSDGSG